MKLLGWAILVLITLVLMTMVAQGFVEVNNKIDRLNIQMIELHKMSWEKWGKK